MGWRNRRAHAKVNCSFARRTPNYLANQKEPHLCHGNRHHTTARARAHALTLHSRAREAAIAMASSAATTGRLQTRSLRSSQDTLSLVAPSLLLLLHLPLPTPSPSLPAHPPLTPIRTTHLFISRGQGLLFFPFRSELERRAAEGRSKRGALQGSREMPSDAAEPASLARTLLPSAPPPLPSTSATSESSRGGESAEERRRESASAGEGRREREGG